MSAIIKRVACGAPQATSVFLTVAKPGDVPNWPCLTLRVIDVAVGQCDTALCFARGSA